MGEGDDPKQFKVAIFNDRGLLEIRSMRQLPQKGDYIHLRNQKHLGYEVTRVVFLDWNRDDWDVALILAGAITAPSREIFYAAVNDIVDARIRRNRNSERDKAMFEEPNEAWQRKRAIYERHKNGEAFEAIAEDMKLTVNRTKTLATEWRRLCTRYTGRRE
jgi:hypothetical protein